MRRRPRRVAIVFGLAGLIVLAAPSLAAAASDIWSNVAPASPFSASGLSGRYPLGNYTLDQHFDAVSTSLTGGVDVSGVPPMIAYFLASILWALTSFMASALISLFSFAFSLDLVNGSQATGGAGALAPVSAAIHSIYANVLGAPWLVAAIALVGIWAMWKALVQRRYSETAGALALSLIYVIVALFFVAQPGTTVGTASRWTNQMSEAFLSIADHGDPSAGAQAKNAAADQLFELLVFKPWVVLNFGGLEHCAATGTGDEDSDPDSVAVRPLSESPGRDAQLARRLQSESEVSADGKVCVNNAAKYASHFLGFGQGTDEREDEYDALNHGDSSQLPDADTAKGSYRLGVADKPATDAMEEGGQYQRLLIAIVVFVGELGAFCLLGSLAVGIILAQVLLLLLLAFAPVALIAAVIPGRGHAFFKGWLEKLAGYLLRKAAYSLILAILLAVNGALAGASAQLGWLMSFGLQTLFFWAVFLQRKSLSEGLIGIATGPGVPGREASVQILGLYGGARTAARPLKRLRRSGGSTVPHPAGSTGGRSGGKSSAPPQPAGPVGRSGADRGAPVDGAPPKDARAASEGSKAPASKPASGRTSNAGSSRGSVAEDEAPERRPAPTSQDGRKSRSARITKGDSTKVEKARTARTPTRPNNQDPIRTEASKPESPKIKKARAAAPDPDRQAPAQEGRRPGSRGSAPQGREPSRPVPPSRGGQRPPAPESEGGLSAELERDRERVRSRSRSAQPDGGPNPPSERERRRRGTR